MRVRAESTANSGTPKVKRLIFITNSQCDISHLSRAEFADIIVEAWVRRGTQWVGISEAREKGGIYSHFHMAKKMSTRSSWRAIGKLEKSIVNRGDGLETH